MTSVATQSAAGYIAAGLVLGAMGMAIGAGYAAMKVGDAVIDGVYGRGTSKAIRDARGR